MLLVNKTMQINYTCNKTNNDITLVPVTIGDIDFLYHLKSEEQSIYWSGYSKAPKYENLSKHYQDCINKKTKVILIIKFNGESAGVISFVIKDVLTCTDYGINISSKFSGQKVGFQSINKCFEYLKLNNPSVKSIDAFIAENNKRSQNIFTKSGFILTTNYKYMDLKPSSKLVSIRFYKWIKYL